MKASARPSRNGDGIEGALRAGAARATNAEDRAAMLGPLAVITAAKRGASVEEMRAASRKARLSAR